jgi:hypothetical protein
MTGPAGEISIDDYNPPPLAVDPQRLADDLRAAATVPHGEAFILAARLYAQALQLIGTVPEIAYQLLISAVETIANRALAKYQPTRDEMIAIKGNVRNRAVQLGLTTEQAEDLAVLACADNHWISRRFRKFLISLVDDSLWTPDTLFRIPQDVVPQKENFEAVLKNIYKTRSDAVHAGQSWRETIHFGWGPTIPAAAIKYLFMGPFRDPPLVWFERVVNLALNQYLQPEGRARLPLAS